MVVDWVVVVAVPVPAGVSTVVDLVVSVVDVDGVDGVVTTVVVSGAFSFTTVVEVDVPELAGVVEKLSGCEALVIECNHDLDMLMEGPYPVSLKHRVSGRFGHLSNTDAGRLVAALERSRLRHLIAAHLSQQNNRPALARAALARAMGCEESWIGLATQDEGFAWREA